MTQQHLAREARRPKPTELGPRKPGTLTICIVNYRTAKETIDCLASILPELPDNATAVVADNSSGDSSLSQIKSWLKANDPAQKCELIELPFNGGFSAGYNAAMAARPAQLYLLLNSDTIVRPQSVKRLLNAATRYPAAGIFGPRLEWADGQPQVSCFRDHSPFSEVISAARTRQVSALLRQYLVPMTGITTEVKPPWISFAAVLIRSELLATVGRLDEGFFLYFEDCEYCHRAREAGWEIVHVPTARVVHLHGQSSQVEAMITSAKRLPCYYYTSRTRYFRLRYGVAGPTLANLGWIMGRAISKTRELIGNKAPHLPEKSWRDIWTNWSRPLKPTK